MGQRNKNFNTTTLEKQYLITTENMPKDWSGSLNSWLNGQETKNDHLYFKFLISFIQCISNSSVVKSFNEGSTLNAPFSLCGHVNFLFYFLKKKNQK
jgi:hypothetical protein